MQECNVSLIVSSPVQLSGNILNV